MSDKLYRLTDEAETIESFVFWCPGCQNHHSYEVPRWTFNRDLDNPTFSPSLLVNKHDPTIRCHLFVRDGKIQYCSDSHHELAGKTVDMEYHQWD